MIHNAPTILSDSIFLKLYQNGCARAGRTFGTWRVISHLTDNIVALKCFDGQPFTIDLRDPAGIQILLHGFEEATEREIVAEQLPPNAVCLDVGANIGVWTRWLSFKCPKGKVYSFEPSPSTFTQLKNNSQCCDNVTIIQAGCGATHYNAFLSIEPSSATRHVSEQGEQVELITIDSLNLKRVDFIKIDVEGMEIDVLKGAAATIKKDRPLILFEYMTATTHRYQYSYEDIKEFLVGYSITRIPETNNYLAH